MEQKNNAESFVEQMQKLQEKFVERASEYGNLDLSTLEVEICNYYLILRVEGEDEYGDGFAAHQELEYDDDAIYQKTLIETGFYVD